MSPSIAFTVPWAYFIKTRLAGAKDFVFHSWYEWLPAVVLTLLFSGNGALSALSALVVNAIGFMALYEIGYIVNDVYSTRAEDSPRDRLNGITPSSALLASAIIVRVVAFLAATWWLGKSTDLSWFLFYGAMCSIFALHNFITDVELRVATFLGLAFFRFFGTIIGVVQKEALVRIVPAVLVFYVFFRALGYLDSKGMLRIESRRTFRFRISYYLFFAPFSVGMWCVTGDWWMLTANVYGVIFWAMLSAAESVRRRPAGA